MKMPHRPVIIALLLTMILINGCSVDLHHDLSELQANEIIMVLAQNGISAEKKRDGGESGRWVISVQKSQAEHAMHVIVENEYPRQKSMGFQELFQKDTMLPTAAQEKTRFLSALCGELQQTLEEDDAILRARVHIFLPGSEKHGKKNQESGGSAAVFLKTVPGSPDDGFLSDEAVQSLIAHSAGNMLPEDVTVVRTQSKKIQMELHAPLLTPVAAGKHLPSSGKWILTLAALLLSNGIGLLLLGNKRKKNQSEGKQVVAYERTNTVS